MLQSLPESFGQLDAQPDALQSLPESFGQLDAQPVALQSLPVSFGQLDAQPDAWSAMLRCGGSLARPREPPLGVVTTESNLLR